MSEQKITTQLAQQSSSSKDSSFGANMPSGGTRTLGLAHGIGHQEAESVDTGHKTTGDVKWSPGGELSFIRLAGAQAIDQDVHTFVVGGPLAVDLRRGWIEIEKDELGLIRI